MKSQSTKIFLCCVATIWLFFLVGDFLPISMFDKPDITFRAWEAVLSGQQFPPFLPNYTFEQRIHGDLSNLAKISELRKFRFQRFSTDQFGFRNSIFKTEKYFPIVCIGDSDMAGSSLSDDETYTSVLEQMFDDPVYNYAPMSPLVFLGDERFYEKKPKILIWEAVEGTIIQNNYHIYTTVPVTANIIIPDESRRKKIISDPPPGVLTKWCQWAFHTTRWRLTGLHNPRIGYIDPIHGMIFYKKGLDLLKKSAEERGLATIVEGIARINDICRLRGITLLYMPLPDKENIYQQWLPAPWFNKMPVTPFVCDLVSALNARGVATISLYESFRADAQNNTMLYFEDDTHWNSVGVNLAARKTIQKLADLWQVLK